MSNYLYHSLSLTLLGLASTSSYKQSFEADMIINHFTDKEASVTQLRTG